MGPRPEGGDGVSSATPVTSMPPSLFLYSFFHIELSDRSLRCHIHFLSKALKKKCALSFNLLFREEKSVLTRYRSVSPCYSSVEILSWAALGQPEPQ